jgi:hypothetical protein
MIFAEQYAYLVRSIAKVHPEATPVIYMLSEFPQSDIDMWKEANDRIQMRDWRDHFDISLGLDTNFARTIKMCREDHPSEVVVGLDCDCVVARRIDHLLEDGIDVVMSTRGNLLTEHGRQDVVWAPALYRPNERATQFLDTLLERAMKPKWTQSEETSWFEIQTEASEMLAEANPVLDEHVWNEKTGQIEPTFSPVDCDFGYAVVRVVDFLLLANSVPKRYGEAAVIHYKREKNNYRDVYRRIHE